MGRTWVVSIVDRVALGASRAGVWLAILIAVGGGAYIAMTIPAYRFADEPAQAGYALVVSHGHLPTIDTPVPSGRGDHALDDAIDTPYFPHRRDIYVANNPPFAYFVAAPALRVLEAAGVDHPGLYVMRALDVAGVGAAVFLIQRLARDLSGGDEVVGLGAAGLLATTVGVSVHNATAGIDGLALAASVGVLWGAVRALRVPGIRRALELGAWVALCAAIRPMTMVYAMVAVAAVAAVVVIRAVRGDRSVAQTSKVLAALVVPSIVVAGWWYVRNIILYGDPTASEALFVKVGRKPNARSWYELVLDLDWIATPFNHLLRGDQFRINVLFPSPPSLRWTIAAVVVVVGMVVAAGFENRQRPAGSGRLHLGDWSLVALMVVLQPVIMAVHVAGGGGAHPRYLLPVLPLVTVAFVTLLRRLPRRIGGVLVVVSFGTNALWYLRHVRHIAVSTSDARSPSLMGQPWRGVALLASAAGVLLLFVALAAVVAREGTDSA